MDFGTWVIGFIEGEGSFSNCGRGYPNFSIGQKNRGILEKIRDFFKVGSVYRHPKKEFWEYRVFGPECWIIRQFCEGKLIMDKKKEQFEQWKTLNWSNPYYISRIDYEEDGSRWFTFRNHLNKRESSIFIS